MFPFFVNTGTAKGAKGQPSIKFQLKKRKEDAKKIRTYFASSLRLLCALCG